MEIIYVLVISIILQIMAAIFALRLIRVTGSSLAWIVISAAVSLMAIRRFFTLFYLLSEVIVHPPDLIAELVALTTSALMVVGIVSIAPLFLSIKRSEEALRKVNRALKVLTMSNQIVIRATKESSLLKEICQAIVKEGEYRFVWVGFAEHDEEKTVRPVAQAGYEQGYLETVNVVWADTERGHEPTGNSIRTGKPCISKNILTDPELITWRDEAIKRGYASLISLPLIANDKTLGALSIYAMETDAFDSEEANLLNELASNMAFGIETLRTRAEHMLAKEHIQHQLHRITALRNIDRAISGSMDLHLTLDIFLEQVTERLGVHAADVLLLDPLTQTLNFATSRGFRSDALKYTSLRVGEGHAGLAALERHIVSITNFAEAENCLRRSPLLAGEDFISYCSVPLIARGHIKGVLEIFYRTPFEANHEWLDFLEALAAQAAIAIDNASLFNKLERSNVELILAYDTTLEGWSHALDLRDKETEGHSQRVTNMTLQLARAMGLKNTELLHIRRGALLHDIGKIGIPDSILLKPEPLNDDEWEIMHKHPVFAYELISPIEYLHPVLDIPYCHHEKWDGTGYPRGIKGKQIPLAARIFAVVDVWESLLSDRPYRPAWPKEKVYEHIHSLAGTHFDPEVVDMFLELIAKTGS